ncbi:hypothetical protein CR492_15460 [Methylocella silvestris]|uniref:Lnb N-terminal periplasmic domain-containing protein n=2 Tax=Methylocella silvestris TaxID=199596 RepID=A0A2J7TE50_METSI|nr:hypothetical protein CR492_15460 [Methylocella silvestris]
MRLAAPRRQPAIPRSRRLLFLFPLRRSLLRPANLSQKERMIWRLSRSFAIGGFIFVLLLSALWGSFALWFQLPLEVAAKAGVIALFNLLAALTIAGTFWRRARRAFIAYGAAYLALILWWGTIHPTNDRDFAPPVAHGATGVLRGDVLTMQNVRNFSWRSASDFSENWEERSYKLSDLTSADFYLVYFMGPLIAHSMVSFGFKDGRHLLFSIEIRPERGEAFSAIAGFFKRYELVFLAGDERDYLFLRKAQDEDTRLYRLAVTPEQARALLLQYVREANRLELHPQFYNTLTANCTTTIFVLIRSIFPYFPLDWRVLLNGFLPSFAYQHGLVDTRIPLDELIRRAAVSDRIKMGLSEVAFGQRLRENVPDPNAPLRP